MEWDASEIYMCVYACVFRLYNLCTCIQTNKSWGGLFYYEKEQYIPAKDVKVCVGSGSVYKV